MNSEDSSPSPLILRLALGGLACAAAYPLTKFLMVHVPIAAFILFLVISGGAAPILKARRTGMPFAILSGALLGILVALLPWFLQQSSG